MIIYKYSLSGSGTTKIELKHPFQVLTVQLQNNIPHMWAAIDPDGPEVVIKVSELYTGINYRTLTNYIGTTQDREGFVSHFYFET